MFCGIFYNIFPVYYLQCNNHPSVSSSNILDKVHDETTSLIERICSYRFVKTESLNSLVTCLRAELESDPHTLLLNNLPQGPGGYRVHSVQSASPQYMANASA